MPNNGVGPQHNHGQTIPMPPGFFAAPPNMPQLQAMLAQQQQMRAQAGMQNAHNHTHTNHNSPGLPGDQFHNHTHHQAHQDALRQAQQSLQDNVSGVPNSQGPTTTTVHEGIGPNGSRMRVVVNETVNYHVSRQGSPAPSASTTNRPPSANPSSPMPHAAGPQPSSFGQAGIHLPPLIPLQDATQPSSTSASGQQNAPTAGTTAWLLSTPTGPQALVFAPGHGYFSSAPAPTPTTAQLTTSQRSTRHDLTQHAPGRPLRHRHTPGQAGLAPAGNAANAAPAQVVVRPAGQGQVNDENDLFHLIVQRGWLFLRLYIFMFVLSEPGTWRRWILLAVAVIACLLPRENPLRDLTNRVRAHIEGLIPVAATPGQGVQVQQGQNAGVLPGNATAPRPDGGAVAGQRDSGHAAARPNQNQGNGNRGLVRDAIYRVERAVALFLASLVPGVGERHVRAREEARREAERAETEHLAAENARIAEESRKDEVSAPSQATEQEKQKSSEGNNSNTGNLGAGANGSGATASALAGTAVPSGEAVSGALDQS